MSTYKASDGYTWHIEYNPKPIPDRRFDWDFWSENYCGPDDWEAGEAHSEEAAKELIEELIEEWSPSVVECANGACDNWLPKDEAEAGDGHCPECKNFYTSYELGPQ